MEDKLKMQKEKQR